LIFCFFFFSRFPIVVITGLLSPLLPVARSAIADLTDYKSRAIAFSGIGAAFACARLLATSTSSFLSHLDVPGLPIFTTQPYLLPCAVASLMFLITLILALIVLPETKKKS